MLRGRARPEAAPQAQADLPAWRGILSTPRLLFRMALVVPRSWQNLHLSELEGPLLVVGQPDTGKSSFARYLFERLQAEGRRVAYLDGDPGQSHLGPPTTITLAFDEGDKPAFPPRGLRRHWFVGAVSPRGHLLPLLVGALRLVRLSQDAGVNATVYDTSGLVDPAVGGNALKQALVEALQPSAIFAIQRRHELESLLLPWRRFPRLRLFELPPSPAVQTRDMKTRRAYRAEQFAAYFTGAHELTLNWLQFAVLPAPRFVQHRLIALRDATGFTLGLGIVLQHDAATTRLDILTPLPSLDGVVALHLGDISLDPQTFRDQSF